MKYAILSDIHSNADALKLVLKDMKTFRVDAVYNLGDIVGYGTQPVEVIKLLIDNSVKSVMGNHDEGLVNTILPFEFTWWAKKQLEQNRQMLNTESLNYLSELPDFISENKMRMAHGIPPDNFCEYINHCSTQLIYAAFHQFNEEIAFVGHTHRFGIYQLIQGKLRIVPFTEQVYNLHYRKTIVNVGSVGLPRDGDCRPGYIIYDQEKSQVIKRRVNNP